MTRFGVVLHAKGENERDSYFTNQNEIVEKRNRRGQWATFDEASKAAMRARLQDPLNRTVTVFD